MPPPPPATPGPKMVAWASEPQLPLVTNDAPEAKDVKIRAFMKIDDAMEAIDELIKVTTELNRTDLKAKLEGVKAQLESSMQGE